MDINDLLEYTKTLIWNKFREHPYYKIVPGIGFFVEWQLYYIDVRYYYDYLLIQYMVNGEKYHFVTDYNHIYEELEFLINGFKPNILY